MQKLNDLQKQEILNHWIKTEQADLLRQKKIVSMVNWIDKYIELYNIDPFNNLGIIYNDLEKKYDEWLKKS